MNNQQVHARSSALSKLALQKPVHYAGASMLGTSTPHSDTCAFLHIDAYFAMNINIHHIIATSHNHSIGSHTVALLQTNT